jgi:Rrf2 family protein
MIFSKTTEYAVRILTFMVSHNMTLYTAKYLHEQLQIPYRYLSKLMTSLVKNGYLSSVRGREGGYNIKADPSRLTVSDIMEAVEGIDGFKTCVLGLPECSEETPCAMHYVWEKNKEVFVHTLRTTTIAELTTNKIGQY